MKKILFLFALVLGFTTQVAQAQTPKLKVGTNPTTLNSSAALEVQSTNKGFLPPRMNLNQISAIASPAEGLSVYCTDCSPKALLSFDGANWVNANGQQPIAPPSAPTAPLATAGVGSASVAFTLPVSTGSAAIASYTVTSFPGGRTATGTASPIVVPGLTAGTAYTFTVRATNGSGLTATSVQSNSVTPTAGVPSAPTALVATSTLGNSASVAFTAPANNGGAAITGYTITSTPGGFTATGATSPLTVTGLTNGTAYTFTAIATNAQGNSVASAASNSVTPQASAPGAPTIGTATISGPTASVAFTAPTNNGGAAITSYTVTSSPGNITATGTTSPISVPGLSAGTAYTFTVIAANSAGNSTASAVSNSVTASGVPNAPGTPTVSALSNTSGSVSFSTPSNNGSAITGYTVTPSPATTPATFTGTSSPITVTGLTTGTAYTFSVTATNAVGTSNSATTTFTPQNQVPGAPASVVATAGNAQATVTFTAPANNGGAAITGYTVTSSPGGLTATGAASPLTVTGLTNGTSYRFSVVATNSVGNSVASAPSNSVIPVTAGTTIPAVLSTVSQAPLAAYSLRKVNSSYTGSAIRVRRSSDNTEQNFGFNASGNLDETAITTFVGASNDGFITVWYDQSGNNRNATNTNTATQPKIVSAGNINKKGTQNRASIAFNASYLETALVTSYNDMSLTAAASLNSNFGDIATYKESLNSNTNTNFFRLDGGGRNTISRLGAGGWTPVSSTSNSGTDLVVTTAQYLANNIGLITMGGSAVGSRTLSSLAIANGNVLVIGRYLANDGSINGNISELLVYKATDLGASRSSVEANLITYYGSTSPASNTIITATAAPSSVVASAGNSAASVSFATVAGATSYTVTSNPGNISATGTNSPVQVNGLTNGTAYTFTVTASNAVGTSAASTASNSVTPAANASGQTVANAPTIGTATTGITPLTAVVNFTAPENTGNTPITGYTVTSNPGGITATSTTSPITVTGLTAGTSYTFTVRATNSVGTSIPSAVSNVVVAGNVPTNSIVNGVTTFGLTAIASVSANNNGINITQYTATVNPGNLVFYSSTPQVALTLPSPGSYTVSVSGTNSYGTSTNSAPYTFSVVSLSSPQLAFNISLLDANNVPFSQINSVDANTLISVGGTCPSSVTWQGFTYGTANIGGQCWMNRNFKGTPTASGLTGTYGFYLNGSDETTANEGMFYSWAAIMNGQTTDRAQGICPTGWHVPSSNEFKYLLVVAGQTIESINTNTGYSNFGFMKVGEHPQATNFTGFNGVGTSGTLDNQLLNARVGYGLLPVWWSSTSFDADNAYRLFPFDVANNPVLPRPKIRLVNLRCLKD
jgi:uncharacterized protein (TIGR02145 family)